MHYGDPPAHIAKGLIELRKRIAAADIPSSRLDESLNVATWNIREFGKKRRLKASIYYIAEILNQFDLIALTELRDDLSDLDRVMDLLDRNWEIVFSDYTGDPGGNSERIGYLFDTRMVRLTGLVAEADTPRTKNAKGDYLPSFDWWRSPYMASFQAGNFDFVVLTAHIRWGDSVKSRAQAIDHFRQWVTTRRQEPNAVDVDFIVMGDFNIPSRRSSTYKALTRNGELMIPKELATFEGTNLEKKKTYDQIAHSPTQDERFSGRGGVLDFYRNTAGTADWKGLYPDPKHRPKSQEKFTFEISDHLPLWLQIRTDFMDAHLQKLAKK